MKKSFKKSILFMWFVLLGFIMPMQMSAYYIAGWGGDWNHREMGNNQYTYYAQTAGDYQFKISEQANWNKQWACGTTVNVSGVVTKNSCNNGDNISVKLTKNADVTISFNGSVITVTATEVTVALDAYLKGSFDTWGTGKQMTKNGDQFELKNVELGADTQLKINYAGNIWAGYDQVKSGDKGGFCTRGNGGDDNNIIISVTGTYSFYYKQASNEIYMVLESSGETGGDDEEDDYIEALECDAANTRIIYTEDFGTFSDDKGRDSYSKSGTGFTAKVPTSSYTAMTTSCTAIENAGYYAVLANPFYAGCGTQKQGDTHACECNNGQWYQNITDHTGNTNGGMLFYNCRDGKSQTDILYESTVDVCQNTYINFSAYIASATAANRGCSVKAKVRFILYDAESNAELSRYTTDYIPLEEGKWEKIAVMFNSKSADKVTLKLLNLAESGCGNDLLLDDITFSVCTPKANLVCSNGTAECTLLPGQKETLTASITSGVMENPYYLWQYQSNKAGWMPIGQPEVNKTELEVIPETNPTLYRVIIANTAEEALNIASQGNPSACGMYAITNTVTANVVNLGLISNLSDGAICADGVDKNTLTLTVSNPLAVAATGVKVVVEIPAGVTAYNSGTTTEFTGFAEFDLAANGTKTLKLDLKSTAAITASVVKSIKSYIAKTFDLTWDSESALVKVSSDITVNPIPTAKFAVASENICKGSTTTATNVVISNGSPNYTLTIGGTNYTATSSPYLFAVNPTSTTTYTLTKVMDAKGCYSTPTTNNKVTVNVEEIKITTHPASTSVCVGAGATFSVVASGVDKYQWQVSSDNSNWNNISGAIASTYTISATTANDNNKYYRVIVSKNGGKCEQQESNSAMLTVKTTVAPSVGTYNECAKDGQIQLSTLATGTSLKFYSDAALTNEVTAFSASEVVTGKKYYATQTINGCTSAAAPISVTVKGVPTLNSVSTDKNAICKGESNAELTYSVSGGLAPYTLYIDRTEAGTTTTVNPSVSATGTYPVNPSSDATYEFTKVVDANGCESTSDKKVSIDVQEINVIANISDDNVCADKTKTFTVNASGDNLNYKWYESTDGGISFAQVGTNLATYTTGSFSMGDQKQYKVEVYQNPEVCKAVEGLANITVQDCSGFEITYIAETSAEVCKGDNIKLKVTLKNNSSENATNVEVVLTDIADQRQVSRNPSSGSSYTHSTGIWAIPSLASGATATLTLEIEGTNVVKDLVSKAYVIKSGTTTYTEATTKAFASKKITVKDITAAPTLIPETYKGCPEEDMLNLNTQVSSDATNLKFYTTETGTELVTQANKNTVGTTTYWVSNTKAGECESPRTRLDIVVYPQPTAVLSGDATICNGGSANLLVTLTGKSSYTVKLSNGSEPTLNATGNIPVSPTSTTTYTLLEVKDGNGCYAKLSGSAKVTVNNKPSITINENPHPSYCAGMQYTLPSVTVTNNGSTVTSEGWYLAGVKLNSNNVTFQMSDAGKTLVYKASNTCGETENEFIASLVVEDCADIILNYSLDKRDYCAGDEAVLTATIKNNGTTNLSNVKLYQTWSGAQNNVTTTKDKGTYSNGNWNIPTLAAGESATLTITFKATTAEIFKMHVTAANGVTYSSYDASVANGFAELVVKEISANVQVNNYIACPNDNAEFPITNLVTSNNDGLKVMGKNDAGEYYDLTSVPMVNPSVQTASTTYYITNIENGKCESTTPTPVTVEVYKPVTASISAPKEVCYGNNSAVEISLDGVAPYVVVYNNGTSDVTLDRITTSTVTINDALYTTTTYSLVSVTDKNGCEAPISSGDKATINVNELPTIASVEIEDDDDYICQGTTTNLIVTFTGNAPFTFTINGTQYTSNDNEFEMEISQAGRYVVENLVDAKCSSAADSQASATLFVEAIPVLNVTPASVLLNCNLPKTTISASGAFTYSWTDDKQSAPKSGSELEVKQTGSQTIYTVVGTSEHGCVSEPVSVTVTENFVAPTVEMTTYNYGEEVDLEKDLILTCNHYAVTLKADTENSPVDIASYKWSTGAEGETYSLLIADAAGIYSVEVTGVNGCKATGNIEVKENFTLPDITLKSYRHNKDVESTILTCSYPALDLKATINNPEEIGVEEVYLYWEIDGRDMSGSNPLTVYAPGEYKVYIQGDNYCKNSATINITEDTEHPELKLTASSDKITCDITEVELTVESNIKEVDYDWISWNREDGQGDGISNTSVAKVEKGGDYEVIVTVSATGCANSKRITIEEYTDLPVVEIRSSEEKVTCKPNTLTASGANTYTWSTEEAKEAIEVTTGGTYTVYGKNEYGCVGEAEITLEEDKLAPSIKLTADTTWVTCRREKAVLTAEVTNAEDTRTYSYAWAQNNVVSNVTKSTFDAKVEATYKVTITDDTNACKAEKTINIKENKQNPLIDIKSLPSVCLPATVDLKDAVGPNTKADEVKYFADATLTQQLTDTNIEAAANAVYYVVGYEIDNNGCVGDPIAIPVVLKPSTSKPVVENYDECAEAGTKTLSSLVKSDKTKLVFFEDETSEVPIADLFSTSAENTTTTYWVSNTKTGACESERVAIEVKIAGYIDFSVEASQTRLPAGQEVTITVTPLSDTPVDEYVWYRGDEVVQATDELELTEQLYLNEKYSVQAVGRCNSPKKEVDVEAIWPTAFTPHNGNGKNDSFADGMNIIVFNRFYTKIYEGPDGWDGSINGAMNDGKETAVPGVYYYSVQLPNGQVKKGTIEIVKVD